MDFKNGVKNIQTVGCNGARTIYIFEKNGGASPHIPIGSGGPDAYHEAIVIRSMTDK